MTDFQFDDDFIFHQEVETVRPNQSPSVLNGALELSQKLQSLMRQFYAESAIIIALQQTWSERPMDGNGAADDALRELIQRFWKRRWTRMGQPRDLVHAVANSKA